MNDLLLIAAKSLLIAGAALLLLKLMHKRSAADRSWVAHLGLSAVLVLPLAAVALPSLDVQGPSMLIAAEEVAVEPVAASGLPAGGGEEGGANAATFPQAAAAEPVGSIDWAFWAYAAPAGLLIAITLIALLRLFLLKARATVLVEPHWLTALARAQRRMNFKHGTALLTSDDLPSPISWGVVRPVILLNTEAASSHEEAEAIITHELAHVARLDWAKLLLARVATAIFWFNPLVWLLAREAHQLREEAADDAVLNSDIEDTEYARLLVGVARHECRGLLIGAHGVAPGRSSLARRIKRVLDSASARAPGGWRWSSAAAFFAAGMAVPVAALNFVPPAVPIVSLAEGDPAEPYYVSAKEAAQRVGPTAVPTVSGAATAAVAAHPHRGNDAPDVDQDFDVEVDIPEDLGERINESVAVAVAGLVRAEASTRNIDELMAARVHGVTPAYAAKLRAAAPQLSKVPLNKLIALKVQGVTPEYVRDLNSAGMRWSNVDQLIAARVQGVNGAYLRSLAAVGYPSLSSSDAVAMRIHGVSPKLVERLRKQGYGKLTPNELVAVQVQGGPDADESP